ncbi:hypothetical protein GCM10027168_63510 [Streptomyces capparidis]
MSRDASAGQSEADARARETAVRRVVSQRWTVEAGRGGVWLPVEGPLDDRDAALRALAWRRELAPPSVVHRLQCERTTVETMVEDA